MLPLVLVIAVEAVVFKALAFPVAVPALVVAFRAVVFLLVVVAEAVADADAVADAVTDADDVAVVAAALVVFVFSAAVLVVRPVPVAFLVTTVVADEVFDDIEADEYVLAWLAGLDEVGPASCGPSMPFASGRGGGAILPLLPVFSFDAVRRKLDPAVPAPRLACSTMPWREAEIALVAALAADFRGEAGLRGEVGRPIKASLDGDCGGGAALLLLLSLIGDRGKVRELCDLGDSTLAGAAAAALVVFDAARVAVVAGPFLARLGFLGLETVFPPTTDSFSLSDKITISELRRFVPLPAACCLEVSTLEVLLCERSFVITGLSLSSCR